MYDNVTTSPPPNTGVPASAGYDYAINDKAVKLGSYIDTSSANPAAAAHLDGDTNKPTVDPNTNPGTLGFFNVKNLNQQFYLAHMCKLIYFPVFSGVYFNSDTGTTYVKKEFGDFDRLKVGDYISSYFIGSSPVKGSATPTYEGTTTFGDVQWDSGPRSVVGKIVAINKVYRDIYCNLTNVTRSMEFQAVYVYEFVNPGSYKNFNDNKGRPRHGSSYLENGFNQYRNDNRNAGVTWTLPSETTYPRKAALMADDYEFQKVNPEVMATAECGLNPSDPAELNMNGEMNTSLSFLWSCRGTDTRSLTTNKGDPNNGTKSQISSFVQVEDNLGTAIVLGNVHETFTIGATIIKITYDATVPRKQINPYSEIVLASGNAKIIEFYNYKGAGYIEIHLEAGISEAKTAGTALNYLPNNGGIYWYPRQYQVNVIDFEASSDSNRKWNYGKVAATSWDYWGAIVKMNPDNDNIQSYTPDGTNVHRLYIPFTEQGQTPEYLVKHFGSGDSLGRNRTSGAYETNPGGAQNYSEQPFGSPCTVGQDRRRQNFGVSTGRGAPGNALNNTSAFKPVPYNLTDVNGWGFNYVGKTNMLNQQSGNSYNDSVCSIHFQNPLTGALKFDQGEKATPYTISRILWQQDILYIKKFKTEIKPKPGYYNFSQVAEDINLQLHLNNQDYKRLVGNNTTTGLRERQKGNSNNQINGNFVHTNLPDLTFGFLPITEEIFTSNEEALKERNISTYRTTCLNDVFTTFFDQENENYNSNVGQVNLNCDFYSIPANADPLGNPISDDGSIQLFRFNGAKTTAYTNVNSMDHQAPSLIQTNRLYDMLNTTTDSEGFGTSGMRRRTPGVCYQTRGAYNNMTCGGCVKVFVGAVNPTFRIDDAINRMVFEYLYTPYRPATDDTGSTLQLVGGQAVPSAIIDSSGDGGVTDSLSGIYIISLRAAGITKLFQPIDFDLFPTDNSYPTYAPDYITKSTALWENLGYSENQLLSFEDNTNKTPFLYLDRELIINNCLFNYSDLDISANASNPFYSYCSLWLPPLQYAVEVESNEVAADKQPLTINTPFYLIGSDFPSKHYYGSKGVKLPVMGICSRQFTSFGYAFDLSESAVTYTINEDCIISSIHTRILNNDYSDPLNLDTQSAVIYVVTRPNYYKQMNPEEIQESLETAAQAIQPIQYTPQMFYYEGETNFEAPLFYDDETDEED